MQFLSKIVLNKFIKKEIQNVGFESSYINEACKKHTFISVKIFDLTSVQANILKQTALSAGCDCAVNRGVINCSVDKSDCILSGSVSQIKLVSKKLLKQKFGLSELSDNLLRQIENIQTSPKRPQIMGILNLTPDSFSDGGEYLEIEKAVNHAIDMIDCGADIIDVGAQSTRPNADAVDVAYEIQKTVPIVTALKTAYPHIQISVDTMSLGCLEAVLECGCDIVNDVSFLSNPEFARLCERHNKKLVIMHSRGNSKTMDGLVDYEYITDDIYKQLYKKALTAQEQGLKKDNIIVDLGFGFAKTISQNYDLLKRIKEFSSLGYPILAGVSRKRFMQDTINTKEPKDADFISAVCAGYLIDNGVEYIRVHDVSLTNQVRNFYDRLYEFN